MLSACSVIHLTQFEQFFFFTIVFTLIPPFFSSSQKWSPQEIRRSIVLEIEKLFEKPLFDIRMKSTTKTAHIFKLVILSLIFVGDLRYLFSSKMQVKCCMAIVRGQNCPPSLLLTRYPLDNVVNHMVNLRPQSLQAKSCWQKVRSNHVDAIEDFIVKQTRVSVTFADQRFTQKLGISLSQ